MEKIYSKINRDKLLHVIWRKNDGDKGKMNFILPEGECLQGTAATLIPCGHTFGGPHKHLPLERNTNKTQEAFIMISGSMEMILCDTDDSIIAKSVLKEGDCYFYLEGGHSFKTLEDDALFYEIKSGPYYGRDKDKTQINPK